MTTGARSNEDPEPLQLTEPELAAVTDEAHRLGYRVAAHAEGLAGCAAAIRHGVDTIEHGMYLHRRPDLLRGDGHRRPGPGAHPVGLLLDGGPGRDRRPGAGPRARPWTRRRRTPILRCHRSCRNWRSTTSRRSGHHAAARHVGVKIALGSDVSLATGLEFQRMVHHGLTPAEALAAGTGTAAGALDLDEHIGTVTEGKLADLIVVDGDPLAEPHLLADPGRIWLVLQQGVPVGRPGPGRPRPGSLTWRRNAGAAGTRSPVPTWPASSPSTSATPRLTRPPRPG